MARGRLIDRALATSRKFLEIPGISGKLSEFTQLLFPMIVINTDDYGRMHADALTIKLTVLPGSQRTEAEFETALGVLDRVGLIQLYHIESKRYLQVIQFDEHQPGLNKRTAPKIPPPPEKTEDSGNFQEIPGNVGKFPLNRIEVNRTEVNLTEQKDTCSEHSPNGETPSCNPIATLPLADKSNYLITEGQVAKWRELYPGVNVIQELRSMIGWCDANPRKRKTKLGILRFVNSWLDREQNKTQNVTEMFPKRKSREEIETEKSRANREKWQADLKREREENGIVVS